MDKFKTFNRPRMLKVWLLALACQTSQLFSQSQSYYGENYPGSRAPQPTYYSSPQSYQSYSSQNNSWQTPQGMNQNQVQSVIYPDNSPGYYTPPSSQGYYPPPNLAYPIENSQNGPWSSIDTSPESFDENTLLDNSPDFDENAFSNAQNSNADEEEQNSSDSSTNLPPSKPPKQYSEAELRNFVTFDPPTNPPAVDRPLTEQGHAISYPFEGEFSAPAKTSLLNTTPVSDTHPTEHSSNLSQGKSNTKIIKKASETTSKNASESIIGKKNVVGPAVGATESPYSTQSRFVNTQKHTSVADLIAQINSPDSSENPTDLNDLTNPLNSTSAPDDLNTPATIPPAFGIRTPVTAPNRAPLSNPNSVLLPPANPTPPLVQPPVTTPAPAVEATPVVVTNPASPVASRPLKEISINFNNVAMIEYIRFISRISNKNFIFDDENLQFNVTIVSEEPTTVENLMAALLQELKIRDLSLIEQGNNIIIHRNPRVRSPARIVSLGTELESAQDSELVTRVFRLNTLDPIKASEIIRPLLSEDALVEVLRDTNNLIITDLVTNVNKIAQLIGTLDAPNSGVTIGQYVVRNAFVDSLVDLASKILQPIAQGNPFVLVPHTVSNSIFIVSNSFIVEKALAILQNLDMNEGRTKILSLEGLRPSYQTGEEGPQGGPGNRTGTPGGSFGGPGGSGGFGGPGSNPFNPGNLSGANGYGPGGQYPNAEGVPESYGLNGEARNPALAPGSIGAEGRPSAIFDESRDFMPGGIGSSTRWSRDLPVGHIERTLFFIYKLRYRKGDQIEIALRKIGNSLQLMGTANVDLVSAINSSQWIESSNALIFTGTAIALDKVRELILEVDTPLRQVFIEMLILDTTIDDSLSYSVDWIDRFGGGGTTGEEGFNTVGIGNPLITTAETIDNVGGVGISTIGQAITTLPVATGFLNQVGFAAGVIGTHLTHNGTRFNSIGALVRAVHTDVKANILLNPKIITEDNNTAEIFVGGTDRYKTQSVTNDLGSLVTNNFQFIDVGTTLRVTPLIGNNGIITLEIIQETTDGVASANSQTTANQDFNLIQVLTKTRTVTKIHVPDGFFVILSGMINDRETRSYSRIPCLGGIPILGSVGKSQSTSDNKRNLMLFIRPLIIDTEEDIEDITRRQQDVYREKSKFRRAWNYETDEGLDFLNIRPADPDETGCGRNER